MSVMSQDRRLQYFKNISLFGCAGISCGMWHLGSLTRDQAGPSVLGVQSLIHWTTRKVPTSKVLKNS